MGIIVAITAGIIVGILAGIAAGILAGILRASLRASLWTLQHILTALSQQVRDVDLRSAFETEPPPQSWKGALQNAEVMERCLQEARQQGQKGKNKAKSLPDMAKLYQLQEEDEEFGRGPGPVGAPEVRWLTAGELIAVWRPFAIDALTVCVHTPTNISCALPLNYELSVTAPLHMLLEDCPDTKLTEENTSVAHLGLALTTVLSEALELTDDYREKIRLAVTRHKADSYGQDDMDFVVKRCGSDRPAFIIHWIDAPDVEDAAVREKPLFKVYQPMGLQFRHGHQQELLALCTQPFVAAMYLKVCSQALGVAHRPTRTQVFCEQRDPWDAAVRAASVECSGDDRPDLATVLRDFL